MSQPAIQQYFDSVASLYMQGNATEHSYRGDLKILIEELVKGVTVTNEPRHITKVGAPDYILTGKDEIPIGYIEAKDINANLAEVEKTEQLMRYKAGLDNLILTDYLEFRWFKKGEKVAHVRIGHIANGKLKPAPEQWSYFSDFIRDFASQRWQSITTSETLAKMMAAKARLVHNVFEKTLAEDEADTQNPDTSLQLQYKVFMKELIPDISVSEFSDIYAQTIAYGMFAARLNGPLSGGFTRKDAVELISKSNPFLRKLFQYIAGYELDERLVWVVNALADVFNAANMTAILKNFGKSTQQNDPVIHFYETFLSEYNPALRKSRGVWYTPEPVVNFMVRAVDDILKTEFGLKDGLSDHTKVTLGKREFHKVQLLDPATGTGTFLAEVIRLIYKNFEGQEVLWSKYVDEHLIPRLNGFEILMASYAMAHLKLEMLLKETGHKPKKEQRLRVFLTNSLEEFHPDTYSIPFAQWLSDEANEANKVKRDTPVMVVLGNPPYAISSSNASVGKDGKKTWIGKLIDDYKKDLNEKKLNLDDDYIKFIRLGQHFIKKNGEGILAYISNNSFIDGVTHRQMRKHLLETFDKIYILNLHGSSRKKEISPDGSKDENVFDIMQGVSINLFIKSHTGKKNTRGKVKYFDLFGVRKEKYKMLARNDLKKIKWSTLKSIEPYYFFVPKDFEQESSYKRGFNLTDLFHTYSAGIKTKVDHIAIDIDKDLLINRVSDILNNKLNMNQIRDKYGLSAQTTWEYKPNGNGGVSLHKIAVYEYRPFDLRYTYYDEKFLSRNRDQVMRNFFNRSNIGLETSRNGDYIFIGKHISDEHFVSDNSFKFPLYIYHETNGQNHFHETPSRTPNLNLAIIEQIATGLKLRFIPEKTNKKGTFAPIDILDYIYAVLHSPAYREKYKEFLKIDFPRVPYPTDAGKFWQLVKLGGELRQIHLLETSLHAPSPNEEGSGVRYPISGDDIVSKIRYDAAGAGLAPVPNKTGKVWINETQYFDKVPLIAWEFYIGGYQPAQKWLKDRKEHTLSYDDITHYQKIIIALTETQRIMGEIDKVGVEF